MSVLIDLVKQHAQPLTPLPPEMPVDVIATPLPGIRAVLFDVYGTLIISGSGDVGSAQLETRQRHMSEALAECGYPDLDGAAETSRFQAVLARHHEVQRKLGNGTPEVEIRDVWREFLSENDLKALRGKAEDHSFVERVAVVYESRTNPVAAMPAARETIHWLHQRGFRLGIVSNAQFYTPLLFPALFGQTIAGLGFEAELCFFSFQGLVAKPGVAMYESAARELDKKGISVDEALYVGNDMLNDIWAAQQVGFRTALFAGDGRSLRLRETEPRVQTSQADRVISDLRQLSTCLAADAAKDN